jgi:hypothetical protein
MRYTGAGGAIYVTNAACRILNNTVTQNKGIASSGLYVEAGADRVAVVNNILVNNTEPNTLMTEDLRTGTGATVHHNCFTPEQPIPVPDGNIAADPLFVDAASGNYHLKPDSPCRDAGEDTVVQVGDADLDGSPRRQGPHVDIGAYETPVDLSAVIHQLKVAAGLEVALQATAPVTMLDAVASLRQALGGL